MAKDKVAARKRALEAKARLDAERAARDAEEVDRTAAFYAAVDRLDAAKTAVEEAQSEVDAAVLGLYDLGKTPAEISVLTGLDPSEVRKVKRAAKSAEAKAPAAPSGDPSMAGSEDRKVAPKTAETAPPQQVERAIEQPQPAAAAPTV